MNGSSHGSDGYGINVISVLGKLCPGRPCLGLAGPSPPFSGAAPWFLRQHLPLVLVKMPSSSRHVPASLPFSLSPSSPKPGLAPLVSFSCRAPFSRALCNPPYLTSCPCIKSPCLTRTPSIFITKALDRQEAQWNRGHGEAEMRIMAARKAA